MSSFVLALFLAQALYSGAPTVTRDYDHRAENLYETYKPSMDFMDSFLENNLADARKLVREAHEITLGEALNPRSSCFETVLEIAVRESVDVRRIFKGKVDAMTLSHKRAYKRLHNRILFW